MVATHSGRGLWIIVAVLVAAVAVMGLLSFTSNSVECKVWAAEWQKFNEAITERAGGRPELTAKFEDFTEARPTGCPMPSR